MIDTEQIAHWTHAIKNSGYSEKEIEADLKSLNNLLAEVKRLREHNKQLEARIGTIRNHANGADGIDIYSLSTTAQDILEDIVCECLGLRDHEVDE